jgi:uncharacterized protein YjbI with pentapeptide repeats
LPEKKNYISFPNNSLPAMSLHIPVLLCLLLASVGTGACHEPANASAGGQVLAGEILTQMAQGWPVNYDDKTIVGDLNLSTLPDARAKSTLSLINCTVANASFAGLTMEKDVILAGTTFENVSFDQAVFEGRAYLGASSFLAASFTGATFRQPAVFDWSQFRKNASFVDAQFDKDASFNGVDFQDADFNYSVFDSYSFFSQSRFSGDAGFSDVTFAGTSDFSSAVFCGTAYFIRSRFDEGASFQDASFAKLAQFGLGKFQGLSSFGNVTFAGEANYVLARFSDAAYFSEARFLGTALFGLTKFEDIASFQKATFAGDLILKSAQISTILLDDGRYGQNARIILNDSSFDRLKVHWVEIESHVVWDPGSYLALVNNYRNLGWSKDEDDCYYQYRYMDQMNKGLGWSRAIDILAWISCGYGVRPSYAVAWSLLTILFFSLIYWRGDGIRRSAKPLQGPAEQDSIPERVTFRNALFFSTMIFLSQGPIDFLPLGRHRYFVILEGIFGWLLLALFLVTLGKVMIR